MIKLTFLKLWMSIIQVHQNIVIFATICIFLDQGFKFQPYVCNGCQDLLMMSINRDNIDVLNIYDIDYCSNIDLGIVTL